MKHKVVSFEGRDMNVVTVYRFDEELLRYLIPVERMMFPVARRKERDRFIESKLAEYGALGRVVTCTFDADDEWDQNDPQQRDRRGL